MIAYLKRNLQLLHLIFFKPTTFQKRYENISRIAGLKLIAQQLPFILLLSVAFIALAGSASELIGLEFDWHRALIELTKGVAIGMAGGVGVGVPIGVKVKVAGRVAGGIVFAVALGVVVGVAGGGAGGVVGIVVGGMVGGVAFGVASGVAGGVLMSVAAGVSSCMAGGLAFGMAYFRLFYFFIYPVSFLKFTQKPVWPQFVKLPFYYDEVIRIPLPRLHRLLVAFVQADRTDGMKAINFIIQERPYQLPQARRALFEIAVHDLSNMKEFKQIATAPEAIGFLRGVPKIEVPIMPRLVVVKHQFIIIFINTFINVFIVFLNTLFKLLVSIIEALRVQPKQFESGTPFLQEIPQLVAQYLAFTTIYSRKKQLEVIAQKLKDLQLAAAYLEGYVGRGLVKVVYAWEELVKAEEAALQRQIEAEPIPNPFVVGNPLRREDKEVFQGREDVARMLENEIMRDKSMSPLLLYGKRRIGKTSTLLNLRKLLGPRIIPVYLDGQDAGLTQSDAGFLYQTLAKILQAAPREWTAADSLILPNRQEFEARAFELSGKLLGQLRERLQAENARVLLCLDEYERLDRAYAQGRITDDLLNQLRHYLQHETRLAFLFAGSHRMTERRAIRWSDYLINVKTIKLGFLDHTSAEKLITAPIPAWPLTYEPGVVEQILQITHRQPYLLQAVASDLVDYLNTQQRTRATLADLEEAIRRVLVTAELYFQNTWEEDLTEPERALIIAYLRANENVDPVANKDLLHGLVQNDIFEVLEGRHVFVIDLFKRWILKNLPV